MVGVRFVLFCGVLLYFWLVLWFLIFDWLVVVGCGLGWLLSWLIWLVVSGVLRLGVGFGLLFLFGVVVCLFVAWWAVRYVCFGVL